MVENKLLESFQSAYRAGHSTETALLRVHNDIVNTVDQKKGVFLVLLDLSADFDTVDHDILLAFLRDHIGLDGFVLDLFRSHLSGRTQCVFIAGVLSELSELMFGVPQGSVLGPIEFCTYTIPLIAAMRHYKIEYHIYADDTQLYLSFDTDKAKHLRRRRWTPKQYLPTFFKNGREVIMKVFTIFRPPSFPCYWC